MSMLGSSRLTSLVGYAMIVLTVSNQMFVEQGMPQDAAGWIKLVGGIIAGVGFRLSKDHDVSNAPVPTAVAEPVK